MDSRPKYEILNTKYEIRNGSAIILAIVLTTLLAMIGVLFLLSSRVDSVATSAIGDNENLKLAVDTVVAKISEVLTRDVPGADPCTPQEYYDYPDDFNPWLASLEPNYLGVWPHVTDLYYPQLGLGAHNLPAIIIPEYQPTITPYADADGDGVSDSIWVPVPNVNSSKGKPIYAAIRIIDNGGMLNINTAYKFDPCTSVGSTQLDINLMAFAALDNTHDTYPGETKDRLLSYRCGTADANFYEQNVVWRYGLPNGAYTPFDISDELNLRYRYILNRSYVTRTVSRIETLWTNAFDGPPYVPRDNDITGSNWAWVVNNNYPSPCPDANVYDNRHIATTYNCDRIINPAGSKMFNINSPSNFDKNLIYNAVREALDPNVFSSIDIAQITANLMDYIDGNDYPPSDPRYDPNNEVTGVPDPNTGTLYYGFERPCVYISEIAYNFFQPGPNSPYYDANDPSIQYRSYAIELFKPYWEDDAPEPNKWRLLTTDSVGVQYSDPIIWTGSRRFHVLTNNPNPTIMEVRIPIDLNEFPGPNEVNFPDPCHLPQIAEVNFGGGTDIILQRDVNGIWLQVDKLSVPGGEVNGSNWMEPNMVGYTSRSYERDPTLNKCIRKILSPAMTASPTIGFMNHAFDSGGDMIQAHPANKPFTNIGEIGQLFRTNAYLTGLPWMPDDEASVRFNLAEPNFQNLFNYLTVIDPRDHSPIDPNETRIKGRININTAPWFVLAQLPWLSYHTPNYDLARSIVSNRDTYGAFKSTGELMRVIDTNNISGSMGYYAQTGIAFPALTPADGADDKFEERDAIFTRISNLVTVRSDVFTAYILVRIGADGPQKRVIAIFDRSGVTPTSGKVKIIAIQSVPDPR